MNAAEKKIIDKAEEAYMKALNEASDKADYAAEEAYERTYEKAREKAVRVYNEAVKTIKQDFSRN